MEKPTNNVLIAHALAIGSNLAYAPFESPNPKDEGFLFIMIGSEAHAVIGPILIEEAEKNPKESVNKELLAMDGDTPTEFLFHWMCKENIPWATGSVNVET